MADGVRRAGSGLRPHLLGRVELVAAFVLAGLLAAGLALTLMSSSAWLMPVAALVGLLVLGLRGLRHARSRRQDDCRVAAEAARGIVQVEAWLAQHHKA